MREFNTAAWAKKQSEKQDETFGWDIEVPIDGRKVKFVGASTSGISLVIAASQADTVQKVASVTNFFFSLVAEQEDKDWLRSRLWDNNDPFGVGMIEEISLALIEEWSGERPTQPASGSSSSPETAGRRSTAKHRSGASTRSRSASTGS